MDAVLFLLVHGIAVYMTLGVYLSVVWNKRYTRDGVPMLEKIFLGIMLSFMWLFVLDDSDTAILKNPPRKTTASKKLKHERRRMALEEAKETDTVLLLEASVEHRKTMAALAERRREAERIEI